MTQHYQFPASLTHDYRMCRVIIVDVSAVVDQPDDVDVLTDVAMSFNFAAGEVSFSMSSSTIFVAIQFGRRPFSPETYRLYGARRGLPPESRVAAVDSCSTNR